MATTRFPQDPYAERPYLGQAVNLQRLMEEAGAENAREAASSHLGRRPSPEARLRQLAEITQPHVRPDRVTNRNTLTASPLGAFEKYMGVLGPMAGSPRSQKLQAALGAANAAGGEQRSILGAPGPQVTPGNSYRANALLDAGMQGQQMQQDREMFEQQAIASTLQNYRNMLENRRTLAYELGDPNLYQGSTPQDLAALETQIGLYGGDPDIVGRFRESPEAAGATDQAAELPPLVQRAEQAREREEREERRRQLQKQVQADLARESPRRSETSSAFSFYSPVGRAPGQAPTARHQAERLVERYKASEGDDRRMLVQVIQQEMRQNPRVAAFMEEELRRLLNDQTERVPGISRLLTELQMGNALATP